MRSKEKKKKNSNFAVNSLLIHTSFSSFLFFFFSWYMAMTPLIAIKQVSQTLKKKIS